MKVLYDSQIFDWQINGGISRYFVEVLQRLQNMNGIKVDLKVKHSYNTYIQDSCWLLNKPVLKKVHFKGKLGALKIINEKINRPYSNRLLKNGKTDIFHPTYYDPYFLKYLKKKPLVLTVYDLTNEKFNDNTPLTQKVIAWKKKLITVADHIISISENTKKDIIEYYKTPAAKITTIYLSGGFEKNVAEAGEKMKPENLPGRYILFVGSRSQYKNFQAFVKEIAPLMIKEDISLVAAGGGLMNGEELSLLKEMQIERKVLALPHVSDATLASLYKNAIIFVFPSLYEGFGLPVLEAMQCGCPVLLSDNSSLPEVGGNAAEYFDPFKEGALQNQLAQVLKNEERRNAMKEAGYGQLKKFNWDKTSQSHIDVYNQIAL
ncbi:MAG: glycosyltransferase family 1 protein [Chitinophagaceae bacterium]